MSRSIRCTWDGYRKKEDCRKFMRRGVKKVEKKCAQAQPEESPSDGKERLNDGLSIYSFPRSLNSQALLCNMHSSIYRGECFDIYAWCTLMSQYASDQVCDYYLNTRSRKLFYATNQMAGGPSTLICSTFSEYSCYASTPRRTS